MANPTRLKSNICTICKKEYKLTSVIENYICPKCFSDIQNKEGNY